MSGAFMLRTGRWKYIHYVGFEPELFELETDPEETTSLAANPDFADVAESFDRRLRAICDPEATDFAPWPSRIAGGNCRATWCRS